MILMMLIMRINPENDNKQSKSVDTHQESRIQLQDIQWGMERYILALKERSKTILSIREQMEVKDIMKSRNK